MLDEPITLLHLLHRQTKNVSRRIEVGFEENKTRNGTLHNFLMTNNYTERPHEMIFLPDLANF